MGLLSDVFGGVSDLVAPAAMYAGYSMGGPAGAALAAGGLGFMGATQTNETNREIAEGNTAFNAHQAQLNRDFQADQVIKSQDYATRMSNTAYQRGVADMHAAGLNPMLAYMKAGASTPSVSPAAGSTAQAQNAVMQNPTLSLASSARDVASASQASAAVDQIEATVDKIKEETQNIPVERDRIKYTIQLLAEQAALTAQKTQSETITQKVLSQTVAKLKSETSLLDNQVAVESALDNLGRTSKELAPAASILLDVLRGFKR